jgi:hypothetical protein
MKFYARLHTVRKSFPEQFQDSFSAARTLCRQLDYPAFLCRPVTLLLASKMGRDGSVWRPALPARRQP